MENINIYENRINKICVWCLKSSIEVPFKRKAHVFPISLGGTAICENVCDNCNNYFGAKQNLSTPSVEIALKEPLNISKYYLLSQFKNSPKLSKFKSEYFDYDFIKQILKPKFKYRYLADFQKNFVKQFKRGIYKVFLEQRSIDCSDAFDDKFNFIREFARYGVGDFPVFYCRPKEKLIFVSDDVRIPQIRFTESIEEIINQYGFYAYWFFSHYLVIPTISNYEITKDNYFKYLFKTQIKLSAIDRIIEIKEMPDLDFTYSFMND